MYMVFFKVSSLCMWTCMCALEIEQPDISNARSCIITAVYLQNVALLILDSIRMFPNLTCMISKTSLQDTGHARSRNLVDLVDSY